MHASLFLLTCLVGPAQSRDLAFHAAADRKDLFSFETGALKGAFLATDQWEGIVSCVDLKTGERAWKQGRYGQGQVLLVADNGLLLVTGELGNLMLLRADPTGLVELGSIQALEGKTWNHPVLVGDRLYVRNSQQAACFRLSLQ